MTEREAIRKIRKIKYYFGTDEDQKDIEHNRALNLAIEALEKQIGKEPILKVKSHMVSIYECGECGERADTRWNGCPYCLTKIDWNEEKGNQKKY